jgi:hypothetical protein
LQPVAVAKYASFIRRRHVGPLGPTLLWASPVPSQEYIDLASDGLRQFGVWFPVMKMKSSADHASGPPPL